MLQLPVIARTMSTAPNFARLRALPKAEVHAHLEGCFEPAVLAQWAAQAGVAMPRPRERLLQFEGLADFLHFLDWACGLASTRERLAALSYGYARRLADSGARYADVIVNPTHWAAWQGRLPAMIDAIDAGCAEAEQDGLPPVGLCVSLLRTQSADAAAELVALLADRRIPLGVCPTSNLKLGVYAAIEAHPIDRLRRAGVVVCLNTDDPVLLGASLEGEYALCSQAFGWSDEDLRALARNSIDASFANADVKAGLLEALARW